MSVHDAFAETFGLPDSYGHNMHAWIDCMSSPESPDDGMTSVHCEDGDFIVLGLSDAKDFKSRCHEQFEVVAECAAFANDRNLDVGGNPFLMMSSYARDWRTVGCNRRPGHRGCAVALGMNWEMRHSYDLNRRL